ncbi:MAG: TPM domain-containing protein [Cyanobacteria bacterium]|nr:TPM domain-containing protein [Cyanobacteriota bacterium]MDA1021679.1 TPM domain-containing protein [Cyanobacteriota bacterium]
MKKSLLVLLFVFIVQGLRAETPEFIKAFNHSSYVNNFSIEFPRFISEQERAYLHAKIASLIATGNGEMAIAIVDDFYGLEANEFSTALFNHWQIGQAGRDNGVLITIKPTQSGPGRQIYISTGYGAESKVTDALAKRIIEQEIKPAFVVGRIFDGLNQATDSIIRLLNDGVVPALALENPRIASKKTTWRDYVVALVILLWIFGFLFRLGTSRQSTRNTLLGSLLLGSSHHSSSSSGFGGFGGGGFGGGFGGGGGAGGSW